MIYTIIDSTGTTVQFNSLYDVYQFIKLDIADLLKTHYWTENIKIDIDRIYADLQEFYDSGFAPEKTPWIKEGDCWLSDLYSVYQKKQIL